MECCTQDQPIVLQSTDGSIHNNIPMVMGQSAVMGSTSKECFSVANGCEICVREKNQTKKFSRPSHFFYTPAFAPGNPLIDSCEKHSTVMMGIWLQNQSSWIRI